MRKRLSTRNIAVLVSVLMRRRMVPSDSEDVSPNKVNLFRPRYTKLPLANLPDMVKPATDMEEINDCTCRDGRGD